MKPIYSKHQIGNSFVAKTLSFLHRVFFIIFVFRYSFAIFSRLLPWSFCIFSRSSKQYIHNFLYFTTWKAKNPLCACMYVQMYLEVTPSCGSLSIQFHHSLIDFNAEISFFYFWRTERTQWFEPNRMRENIEQLFTEMGRRCLVVDIYRAYSLLGKYPLLSLSPTLR